MKIVDATIARKRLGAVLADAPSQPVVIRRHSKDVAVVVSIAEFDRLRSVYVRSFLNARRRLAAQARRKGLSSKRLAAILADL